MENKINEKTFNDIWNKIQYSYEIENWETCPMTKIVRAEKLELKMLDAFNLIKSLAIKS